MASRPLRLAQRQAIRTDMKLLAGMYRWILKRPRRVGARRQDDLGDIPALVQTGLTEQAERRLRDVLLTDPDHVDALHFLGLVCHQTGRSDEAAALIAKAAQLAPGTAFICANLAEVLRAKGDLEGAEEQAREAVRLAPDREDFQFNLALVLSARRSHAETIDVADRILALQSNHADALALKAEACFETGNMELALSCAERACTLAHGSLVAQARLLRMRAWACDWRSRDANVAAFITSLERSITAAGNSPLEDINPFVTYEYAVPQGLRDAVTERHVAEVRRSAGPALRALSLSSRRGHSRLRIGYVSADFHSHPTMHLMGSFFGLHDRSLFEVFAYSIGRDDGSAYRRRAVAEVDHFCDIRRETPHQSAERIRSDEIDILIDLKGFTFEARPQIFALRPAPLQVAWLGYPASTGTGLNDYAIVDRVTVPPGNAGQFKECLVWMPHTYQVNDSLQSIASPVPSRSELGLPESTFVYACFNHVYKIEPRTFEIWMRILGRVPGSVLWLYGSNAAACNNLRKEAQERGIDPARIVFGQTMEKSAHLARLSRADLFLDTYTCNAHTSASDALLAGVPVLTRPGDTFPSRVGASLVTAAGLRQLVCHSAREYEDTAVRLAFNAPELASMRGKLGNRERLPLFDASRFVRDLETAFDAMWQRHVAGFPPESFAVRDDK